MAWFDKHKKWSRQRADLEREALGASVEELTTQGKVSDDDWVEEEGWEEEDKRFTSGTALIPPRLRLQSRPLPIVRIDVTKRGPAREEREPEIVQPSTGIVRRLGRSTKVRLQAVRIGQESEPITERVATVETTLPESRSLLGGEGLGKVRQREEVAPALSKSPPTSVVCGSGMIEAGQEDATIHNARISAQSVVSIMLAGNPGPVVVHYISLQPRAGFTLHMSAPVAAKTPFNYAIWLC